MSKKTFKVFETFSGIGAQSKALENLYKNKLIDNYKIQLTSDWDIIANISYNGLHAGKVDKGTHQAINDSEIDHTISNRFVLGESRTFKSVEKLDNKTKEWILKIIRQNNNIGTIVNSFDVVKNYIKDINTLTYSFPCQDLSLAGNFSSPTKGIKKGTRSGLLYEIKKLLIEIDDNKLHKPNILLMENVPSIANKKNKKQFNMWLNFLAKKGYTTYWGVINANDFGLLQKRKRAFAVSFLNIEKNPKIYDNLKDRIEDFIVKNNFKPETLQNESSEVFDFNNFDESLLLKNNHYCNKIVDNNPHITPLTQSVRTLTTRQYRNPNAGVIKTSRTKKGYLPYRFISPEEAILLMGFTKNDYKRMYDSLKKFATLTGKKETFIQNAIWKQAGNSITVNSLEIIFYWIYKNFGDLLK